MSLEEEYAATAYAWAHAVVTNDESRYSMLFGKAFALGMRIHRDASKVSSNLRFALIKAREVQQA